MSGAKESRREFLRRTARAAAGTSALAASVQRLGLVGAAARAGGGAAGDYRALVCVFLDGGNDGNNTVVPYDDYDAAGGYGAVRGPSGLAVPRADLLQIVPPSQQGLKYGFHPAAPEMQALFAERRLAVVCNAGALLQPLTRPLYRAGVGHPYQLFSHSDQAEQQQTTLSTEPGSTGWAGRVSDLMTAANGAAPVPLSVSTAGASLLVTGATTRQLVVNPVVRLNEAFRVDVGNDFPAGSLAARRVAFERIRRDAPPKLARAAADVVGEAIRAGEAITSDPALPPLQPGQADFPAGVLGRQLRQVAKLISLREAFGVRRQIFFCSLGGFDHHANQRAAVTGQPALLAELSRSLRAFYDATANLGVASQVTAFTLSDFGRTFQPAGAGAGVGSDHAWGNHHFVVGGAVGGGDFYGTFPTLALGGPDDADERGRWIPTVSTEQYAATLALWFGLPAADLPTVFPLIDRFATPNLGFML